MLKRIISPTPQKTPPPDQSYLNLEPLAELEITSEDPSHPIEAALIPGHTSGWRAATPGKQTIRLIFTNPQPLRLIHLDFAETQVQRTQEYLLRWSPDRGQTYRDIVRQQWNFNPQTATTQTQDHQVQLSAVTILELIITPDISGGSAVASLAQMRLA